jgi:hypothetical protein
MRPHQLPERIELLQVCLTQHVIDRYRQRVDPTASPEEARLVLGRMVCLGHARSTPRHWMRNVNQTPGLKFLYWAELPGVCGLILDGALLTLITRKLCQRERHLHLVVDAPVPEPQFAQRRLQVVEAPKEAA